VFWVISVYFNIRNNLSKSGTFLLGHSVYVKLLLQLVIIRRTRGRSLGTFQEAKIFRKSGNLQFVRTGCKFFGEQIITYSGADKSLARPGRKQADVSVRTA